MGKRSFPSPHQTPLPLIFAPPSDQPSADDLNAWFPRSQTLPNEYSNVITTEQIRSFIDLKIPIRNLFNLPGLIPWLVKQQLVSSDDLPEEGSEYPPHYLYLSILNAAQKLRYSMATLLGVMNKLPKGVAEQRDLHNQFTQGCLVLCIMWEWLEGLMNNSNQREISLILQAWLQQQNIIGSERYNSTTLEEGLQYHSGLRISVGNLIDDYVHKVYHYGQLAQGTELMDIINLEINHYVTLGRLLNESWGLPEP